METCFREIVENIFNRWTALKLAVEHGMAKNGVQTAIDFIDYTARECLASRKLDEIFIMDLLEDIMDEQFNTVCEDDSIKEVSTVLAKYFQLAKDGKIDTIRTELSQLPPCTNWIMPSFQVKKIRDEDSSTSDDDDDDDDDRMNEGKSSKSNTNNAPSSFSNVPSTSGSTMDFEEQDHGWTVVKKGGKYK